MENEKSTCFFGYPLLLLANGDEVKIFNVETRTKNAALSTPPKPIEKSDSKTDPPSDAPRDNELQTTSSVGSSVIYTNISPCENWLIVCDDSKRVHLYSVVRFDNVELVKTYSLVKRPIKAIITPITKQLIVADKSGDVYQFPFESNFDSAQLKPILGHTSMLLDLLITADERFLITCDRDEKIRISNYPNCYSIHSFCLGHTEFILQLEMLTHNSDVLVSGSGDGTIKFWNFKEGRQLSTINCKDQLTESSQIKSRTTAVKSFSLFKKSDDSSFLAVAISKISSISLFLVKNSADCHYVRSIATTGEIVSVLITPSHCWILSSSTAKNNCLDIVDLEQDMCDANLSEFKTLLNSEIGEMTDLRGGLHLDQLYKKSADNFKEYFKRKCDRIVTKEEKETKRKK